MFYLFIGFFSTLGIQDCKHSRSAGCSRMPVYLGTQALSKLGELISTMTLAQRFGVCFLRIFWPNKDNCSINFFFSLSLKAAQEGWNKLCLPAWRKALFHHEATTTLCGVTLGVTRALR